MIPFANGSLHLRQQSGYTFFSGLRGRFLHLKSKGFSPSKWAEISKRKGQFPKHPCSSGAMFFFGEGNVMLETHDISCRYVDGAFLFFFEMLV